MWVPLGLFDNDLSLECAGDFCVDDAMSWDAQRSANNHHGSVESLAFLVRELRVDAD